MPAADATPDRAGSGRLKWREAGILSGASPSVPRRGRIPLALPAHLRRPIARPHAAATGTVLGRADGSDRGLVASGGGRTHGGVVSARGTCRPGWVLLHLPDLASATRPGRSAASEEDRQRRAHRIGSGLDFVGPRDRLLVEAVGLPALVPDGGECWWLDRIVPSFHPTLSPAAFLAGPCRAEIERLGAATGGIATALAGIGMGGQGALGIAYRQPDRFPVVAAVDPRLDFHLVMRDDEPGAETLREAFLEVEHARQQTPILHVHPLHWPRHQFIAADPGQPSLREGVERLRGKLAALGIPHERLSAAGAAATMAAAAFLRERIERESNRLPGGPI